MHLKKNRYRQTITSVKRKIKFTQRNWMVSVSLDHQFLWLQVVVTGNLGKSVWFCVGDIGSELGVRSLAKMRTDPVAGCESPKKARGKKIDG